MGKGFSVGQRPPVKVFVAAALTAGKRNPSVSGTTKKIFTGALWLPLKLKFFLVAAVSAPLKTMATAKEFQSD